MTIPSRWPPERPPSTTATMCRSSVLALVIRLKPEARVKPVLMPSTPSTRPSSLLWLRVAAAGEAERAGLEIAVVVREAVLDRAGEDRQVPGRRHLLRVGQARRVAVDRAAHAERAGLARHQLGEALDGAAEVLGHRDRDVVRRLGHQRLDRVLDRDGAAGAKPELRGRLGGRVGRDLQRRVELDLAPLELLEQQVERHHLGDGGGVAQRVLVVGVERAPALHVDHHGGVGRGVAAAAPPGGGRRRAASAGDDRLTRSVAARPASPAAAAARRRQAGTQPEFMLDQPPSDPTRAPPEACSLRSRCRRVTVKEARGAQLQGPLMGAGAGRRSALCTATLELDICCALHIFRGVLSGEAGEGLTPTTERRRPAPMQER